MIAAAALHAAIHDTLAADIALTGLVGPDAVFDRAPPRAAFPYITFGPTAAYDWSTGTDRGDGHLLTLHIWSEAHGRKQALAIAERVTALLDDAHLVLAGHRLVLLRFADLDAGYDAALRGFRATLRFEALTEATP